MPFGSCTRHSVTSANSTRLLQESSCGAESVPLVHALAIVQSVVASPMPDCPELSRAFDDENEAEQLMLRIRSATALEPDF